MTKEIIIIAGPNGSGKTTTAKRLLKDKLIIHEFLNVDEIAKGLAPLNPESVPNEAGKIFFRRFEQLVLENNNFAFETTGASRLFKHLLDVKRKGYKIHLLFLWLSTPDLAIERVSNRVKEGGHFIPDEVVFRRYHLGIKNLVHYYLPLVDTATILDNSDTDLKGSKGEIIAKKNESDSFVVIDKVKWEKIVRIANGKKNK